MKSKLNKEIMNRNCFQIPMITFCQHIGQQLGAIL